MAVSKGLAIERKFLNELAQQKFDKAKKKTLGSLDNANRTYLSQLLEQEDLINAQRNFFLNSFDTSLNELRRQVYTAQRASRDRQAITGIYDDFAQVRDNNILNEEIDYQISNLLQTSMGNALNVASQQQANLRSQVQATYQGLIENERDEAIESGTATIDHGKQFMKFLSGAVSGALTATFGVGLLKGVAGLAASGVAWGIDKAISAKTKQLASLNISDKAYLQTAGTDGKVRFISALTPEGKNVVVPANTVVKWSKMNALNTNPLNTNALNTQIANQQAHLNRIQKFKDWKFFNHQGYGKAREWYLKQAQPFANSIASVTGENADTLANKLSKKIIRNPKVRAQYTRGLSKSVFPVGLRSTPFKTGLFTGWGFYAAIAGALIGGIINTTKTTSYKISQASLDALKQSSAWQSLADIGGFSVDDIASSLGDSVKNYQKTNWKWPWNE